MFYIVGVATSVFGVQSNFKFNENYIVLDNDTNSIIRIGEKSLIEICNRVGKRIGNADIINNRVKLHPWVRNERVVNERDELSLFDFAVIEKVENKKYKIVDKNWKIRYVTLNGLIDLMLSSRVCNCRVINNGGKRGIKFVDVVNSIPSTEFKEEVDRAYQSFLRKSKLLGLGDLSFQYRIEGNNIILTKYTGKSDNIIIPEFVTSLGDRCFYGLWERNITIGSNIRSIGSNILGRGVVALASENYNIKYYISEAYDRTQYFLPKDVLCIYG